MTRRWSKLGFSWLAWAVMLGGMRAEARGAEADVAAGRRQFAACAACHTPGQPGVAGPDLHGIVGRKAASVPGFRYSRALKNSGIVWSAENLDMFLADPQARVPGNVMPYSGLSDPTLRRQLIAYLETLKRE